MQDKSLNVLEFDKVLQLLAQEAVSTAAKEYCLCLLPAASLAAAEERQVETEDFLRLILKDGELPLQAFDDIRELTARIEAGQVPGPGAFLKYVRILRNVLRLQSRTPILEQAEDEARPTYVLLSSLNPLASLRQRLEECIISDEELSDRASPELYRLRRAIQRAQEAVKTQLEHILKKSGAVLQEQLVTLRDARYVLPVKAEHKAEIKGIVHDSSSSGATLFIEPLAVVELNNKIRILQGEEREEIERILAELAALVATWSSELLHNQATLTQIDFIQAKAKLAKKQKAFRPLLNAEGRILLKKARHPLIKAAEVVPIDIELGLSFRTLVITGPNTGGKTVSLKTCGLLSVMALAGLHIPAAERSELSFFSQVLADIGDEQSIEQSLSTFSAHIHRIIAILETADAQSLVLLDELGAGTDPTEGAALAIALLDEFRQRDCHVMATTHYRELKGYALNTPSVCNACCEFDTNSLRPTYRLLIGVPGVSNALAICTRLGLSSSVIAAAKLLILDENARFEDLVQAIERSHQQAETMRAEIEELRLASLKTRAQLQEEEQLLKKKKAELMAEARQEAEALINQTIAELEEELRLARESGRAERSSQETLQVLKGKAKSLQAEIVHAKIQAEQDRPLTAADVLPGVYYKDIITGFVGQAQSSGAGKGMVVLKQGSLSCTVACQGLRPLTTEEEENWLHKGKQPNRRKASYTPAVSGSFKAELMLLGLTVAEASAAVDNYLAEAELAGLKQVRLVHGKGSGALRQAVRSLLKRDKRVLSFQDAAFGEGDAGVTIAQLK